MNQGFMQNIVTLEFTTVKLVPEGVTLNGPFARNDHMVQKNLAGWQMTQRKKKRLHHSKS